MKIGEISVSKKALAYVGFGLYVAAAIGLTTHFNSALVLFIMLFVMPISYLVGWMRGKESGRQEMWGEIQGEQEERRKRTRTKREEREEQRKRELRCPDRACSGGDLRKQHELTSEQRARITSRDALDAIVSNPSKAYRCSSCGCVYLRTRPHSKVLGWLDSTFTDDTGWVPISPR